MSTFNASNLLSVLNASTYGGYTQGVNAKDAFDAKESDKTMMGLANGIGAITEAYGIISEGLDKSAAFKQNAYIAEQNIDAIERAGEHDLDTSRNEARQLLSRQVAITAATGRSFSGSALDVMARSERQSLQEQNIINYNMRLSVATQQNNAATAKTEAKIATRNAYVGAFTQLMGAGAKAFAGTPSKSGK